MTSWRMKNCHSAATVSKHSSWCPIIRQTAVLGEPADFLMRLPSPPKELL